MPLHGRFIPHPDKHRKVVNAMKIRSEQEAMYLACEMESTAVQLYTRALQLLDQLNRGETDVYAQVQQMLREEQAHLTRFRSFYKGLDESTEQQLSHISSSASV